MSRSALGGFLPGRKRGHRLPPLGSLGTPLLWPSLLGAALIGAILVYLEALFRPGRLSGSGWDVWASWVPKAKSIYFSGGVDAELFASLPGPSYPPGLPALHAAAFHAMGSADAVTLHLQQWFLAVGFVGAVAGLLAPRVRSWILLPLLLLLLLMPDLRNRATDMYGDVPLGYLIAVAALLVLLWIGGLRTGEPGSWTLWSAALLLSGAMLTKREGILFAVCIVFAALVATVFERRQAWPRLGAAALVAFALALPWRVWFTAKDIPSDAPEAGYLGVFHHLDRFWPSLDLVVSVLFDYELWLLVPTLAIASAVLAFLAGARREAVFAMTLLVTAVLGCTWTYWSNPSLEIGRGDGLVNRVVGTPLLMLGGLLPLLLELAWRGKGEARDAAPAPVVVRRRSHGERLRLRSSCSPSSPIPRSRSPAVRRGSRATTTAFRLRSRARRFAWCSGTRRTTTTRVRCSTACWASDSRGRRSRRTDAVGCG